MTREEKAVANREAARLSLTEMTGVIETLLDFVRRGCERRAMAWEGQDEGQRPEALQAAERRFVRGTPRALEQWTAMQGLHAFEWQASWDMYAREWASLEASVERTWVPGITEGEQAVISDLNFPVPAVSHKGETAVRSTSFTQDLFGQEVLYAAESVKAPSPKVVVADLPPRAPCKQWLEAP